MLFDAVEGDTFRASVRSGGRSRSSIRPPRRGWSPAASASRRSRRSAKRCVARGARRRCSTARAAAQELFYLDCFAARGVELVLTTEDGSAGERGRVTAPLERELRSIAATAASGA